MAKHYNTHLPTPGVNLIVKANGKELRAIRPGYITDRRNHDQFLIFSLSSQKLLITCFSSSVNVIFYHFL